MSKEKECTTCHMTKDLTEFYNQKHGKFGKTSRCRVCVLEHHKKRHYELNIKGRVPKNKYDNGKLYVNSKRLGIKVVLYDMEDEDRLKQHTWGVSGTKKNGSCYVSTTIPHPDGGFRSNGRPREARLPMHRYIMNCPKGLEVDHKNHNKLDNRKTNLRICTRAENSKNLRKSPNRSSRFKGVSYSLPSQGMTSKALLKPWAATITSDGISYHLRAYPTEEEAALVYDKAAKQYHGKFACLNFPNGPSNEILRIIKEGQDNLPEQQSEYMGVGIQNNGATIVALLNLHNEGTWHQIVSCEEEGAVLRDQKVVELGIKTPLNFPDGPPDEILKIIEKAKAEEEVKIQAHIRDRYIYRPTDCAWSTKPFYVMMTYNGKQKRIGSYNLIEEARKARNKALLERPEGMNINWRSGTKRKHNI
jgi:hypothetical protein